MRQAIGLLCLLWLTACAVSPGAPPATPPTLRIGTPPGSPLGRLVARSGLVSVLTYVEGDPLREGRRVVAGGSGTLIDADGLVVTAAHIALAESYRMEVTLPGGERYDARLLALLPGKDMAVLCVPGLVGRSGARLRLSDPLPGTPVLAFGSPRRGRIAVAAGRVGSGRLSGTIHYGRFVLEAPLELELAIEPGFSGGPVVDTDGEVVGILAGFALDPETEDGPSDPGLAFAVPGKTLATELPPGTVCRGHSTRQFGPSPGPSGLRPITRPAGSRRRFSKRRGGGGGKPLDEKYRKNAGNTKPPV